MEKKQDSAPADGGEWTKEDPEKGRPFGRDAFRQERSLDDQVTDVLDGKDILDEEASGTYPPSYIPRRSSGGDRGRHAAQSSEPEEEEEEQLPGDPPIQRFTKDGGVIPPRQGQPAQPPRPTPPPRPQRPVNEPPPRPKVVVAEPAPRVVVTPERRYEDTEPVKKGMGRGMKFLIALLLSVAVLLALAALAATLLPGRGTDSPDAPAPSPTDYLFGGLPTFAPAPTSPPAPTAPPETPTPMPTPMPVVYYTISVTAGPGGTVSPNGMVDVEEGGSVTFSITPDWGYTLGQLLIDGSNVSVTESYTFTDVRQGHTLYAVFQQAAPTAPPVTEPPYTDPPVFPDAPVVPDVPTDQELPPAVEG